MLKFQLLIFSVAAVGFSRRCMMVLTAWNAQHIVSSTHAGFPARHKGTLCHAAEMGSFLEDKCEPTLCLSTRARLYLNTTGHAKQLQSLVQAVFYHTGTKIQSYCLFWTIWMDVFYHTVTKLQSYALLQRNALL